VAADGCHASVAVGGDHNHGTRQRALLMHAQHQVVMELALLPVRYQVITQVVAADSLQQGAEG
jgi:hypothetical protein